MFWINVNISVFNDTRDEKGYGVEYSRIHKAREQWQTMESTTVQKQQDSSGGVLFLYFFFFFFLFFFFFSSTGCSSKKKIPHVMLRSSRSSSSSSFFTNLPLTRSLESAKFLRTSYLTLFVHILLCRFAINLFFFFFFF